jgi:hypothetical protein
MTPVEAVDSHPCSVTSIYDSCKMLFMKTPCELSLIPEKLAKNGSNASVMPRDLIVSFN